MKKHAKFKLPNQGAPRLIFFLPSAVLALEVFTYGHCVVATTLCVSKIVHMQHK